MAPLFQDGVTEGTEEEGTVDGKQAAMCGMLASPLSGVMNDLQAVWLCPWKRMRIHCCPYKERVITAGSWTQHPVL
jgi:hypothetical protein